MSGEPDKVYKPIHSIQTAIYSHFRDGTKPAIPVTHVKAAGKDK